MNDIISKFSHHLKTVLTRALCLAVEQKSASIEPKHLLWALGTQNGSVAAEVLTKSGLKAEALSAWVGLEQPAKLDPPPEPPRFVPALADESKFIIEKAVLTASLHEHHYVGTEHLLHGLIQILPEEIYIFLTEHNIIPAALEHNLSIVFKATASFPDFPERSPLALSPLHELDKLAADEFDLFDNDFERSSKSPALDYFCQALTDPEVAQAIDPVIGREVEIARLAKVLTRRAKNNPILVGEPGVGKTAIVEGLAKKIVDHEVPDALLERQIYRLDLAAMVAGTMYRGEFESRLRQLIDEVVARPDIILFIDEVHTIIGAGSASGSLDAANILKPALARGQLRCIGATTPGEYKKSIETDGALERRFQKIAITEPNLAKTKEILLGVRSYYEKYHNVNYSDAALNSAVELAERYLADQFFPDKSIDLLDEAGAAANLRRKPTKIKTNLRALEAELDELQTKKKESVLSEAFNEAVDLKARETKVRNQINLIKNKINSRKKINITADDIMRVVAEVAGVPLVQIKGQEQKLKQLNQRLQRQVIGQREVVDKVASFVRRGKLGLAQPERPLASFLFTGPSGVGKTLLATKLAAELFPPGAFLRLDMSEYAAPFTASKLLGSPAGYVGYREQNQLADFVKDHPYSLLLFDEIEKAHSEIHHLLLQILDRGRLTDATGREVDFRHTIVVLTSNIGSERFYQGELGFGERQPGQALADDVHRFLEDIFSRELLNRLDHVGIFEPLDPSALATITRQELQTLAHRLQAKNIDFQYHPDTIKAIVAQLEAKFGARDIKRVITRQIENPITAAMISNGPRKFKIKAQKDQQIVVEN